MPTLVVLGTGTAVGKTYVTAALATCLVSSDPHCSLLALKPVETGIAHGTPSDATLLARCAHRATLPHPHPLYSFNAPLSPHLAASRSGTLLSVDPIVDWAHSTTGPASNAWILLETPGGTFSPLTPAATNFDLARALTPALWLLVAPDALGVIHDVTATLIAMRSCGRLPDFVVLTASRPPDASSGTNALELEALNICRVTAVLPRHDPSYLQPLASRLLGHNRPIA